MQKQFWGLAYAVRFARFSPVDEFELAAGLLDFA